MEPQGPSNDIPIQIDSNAWQVVLRDGVPTLVPRRYPEPPNQAALVHVNTVQNGNNITQANHLISQTSYEQGLALDFSNQNTPLSDQQHHFLSGRLQSLRATVDQLEQKIDQRRRLTIGYENHGMRPSDSNVTNSGQTQQVFPQPQQTQTIHYGGNQTFYDSGTQNVASGVPRQGDLASGSRTYQPGSTHSITGHNSANMSAGGSSRPHAAATAVPGHQHQPSAESLVEQRHRQNQQRMNQLGSTLRDLQSQSNVFRVPPNLAQAQNPQFQQQAGSTSFQPQSSISHSNGIDNRNFFQAAGQTTSYQTPARARASFPQAHISPASVNSTTQQPLKQSASASTSSTTASYPPRRTSQLQHRMGITTPVTINIPPVPTSIQSQPLRSYGYPASRQPVSTGGQTHSSVQPQPIAVPMEMPRPISSAAPRRPPTAPAPIAPLQPPPPPVAPMEPIIKNEPEEEASLAQAILQFYGKRKAMDSAGIPEPASKRRAIDAEIADGNNLMNTQAREDSSVLLSQRAAEVIDVPKSHEPASDIDQVNANITLPSGDVLMHSPEIDRRRPQAMSAVQPHESPVASLHEPAQSDPVDDFPRIEMLSDDLNIPDTSRSPSARLSSVSGSDAREAEREIAHQEEAEVEGAIMIDANGSEHQRTPVPETSLRTPLPPALPSISSVNGEHPIDGRGTASLLRSPSIPLFQSIDNDKSKEPSRSRSSSLPLFLPVASSASSSDRETVKKSTRKQNILSTGRINPPRRKFIGVNVPYVPGLSRKRPQKRTPQKGSRRHKTLVIETSSSDDEPTALLPIPDPIIDDNGNAIDPYSSLRPASCLWTGCGALLESQLKLMRHVEIAHASAKPPGPQSQRYSRCYWGDCEQRRLNSVESNKLLRHLIKHIRPKMICMAEDCPFFMDARDAGNRQRFWQHWEDAHKNDPNLKFKAATLPFESPPQSDQPLPDFVPASEALFLDISGDPRASLRSMPPSPRTPSQATSIMPLSPTKRGRRGVAEEKKMDEYSFLDPFYPPALLIADLAQNAMELFELECGDAYVDDDRLRRGSSDEP